MKILFQFPEGLKKNALSIIEKYKKEGHEAYLSAAPCFGACDLALDEAQKIGAQKIVHVGHSKFINKELPVEVEYVLYEPAVDVSLLENSLPELKNYKSLAAGTTIQHAHQLGQFKKFLEGHGISVHTSRGKLATHEGQVLGCDASAVTNVAGKSDAVLFIGDGLFHALAVSIDKPVYAYNPYTGQLKRINDLIDNLKKRRRGILSAALSSNSFGILVSTKPGQFNLAVAEKIKKELIQSGKKAEILVSGTFEPSALQNFHKLFDCFITTACPRISDDTEQFEKPIMDLALYSEFINQVKFL